MANRTGSRKIITIILSILGISLVVVMIGLFSLPTLLSTEWAGTKVKHTINANIPGSIDFQSFSLSWFNGVKIRSVAYDDKESGIRVTIADITTAKGLLQLASNYKDIGTVTINDPVVYITLKDKRNPPDTAKEQDENKSTTGDGKKQSSPEPAKKGQTNSLPIIAGQLNVTGGSVITLLPDTNERKVIDGLKLQVNISGLNSSLQYLVEFQSEDGKGRVKGAGNFVLPAENPAALDGVQTQATLDINSWQLADQLSILTMISDSPTGRGLLNGHLGVMGNMNDGIDITVNLTAESITMSGGPLKTDTPSFDKVTLELEAQKTNSALTINQLSLHSPIATGTGSGTIDTTNQKELTGELAINLAQLFAQFPATLNLKEGTRISQGQIDLNAQLEQSTNTTAFDASATLDQLEGIAAKKRISLEKPITLVAKGENSPAGIQLDNFTIQSSFLNAMGEGDINKMQVVASADIGGALKEVKKFINVEEWQSTGKLNLDLRADTTTEAMRSLAGEIVVKDFILKQKGRVIVPRAEIKTKLATSLRLDSEMRPTEVVDTSLEFQTWLGNGTVNVNKLVPPSDTSSVEINDLEFKGAFSLDHLTDMLHTVGALPEDNRLTGQARIDTRLGMKDQKLTLDDAKVDISNLLFTKEKRKAGEKELQIATRGQVDLKAQTAILNTIDITATAGQITLSELSVNDWSKPESSIKTNGSIDLDLALLTQSLADFSQLPPQTDIAGKAAIKLNVDLTDKVKQVVQLDGILSNLKISSQDKPPLLEKSIRLELDLDGDLMEQNITLSKLDLNSAPVSLTTKGSIVPDKKERLLSGEGFITLDLQAISGYLKSLANLDVEMIGAEKKPFTLELKSTDRQWVELPQKAALSAAFHAESIKGFGLLIETLDIPIDLSQGRGELNIQGNVNKGKLSINPILDFTIEQPAVSMPENSAILTNVGLTDDLSKDLLAHINPIFQGAAVSSGTIDLTMQHLKWPLAAEARKDGTFAGSLTFHEVKLQAGGLLLPLLEVMKVEKDEREIVLGDQPMEFVAENERVSCSSLAIIINEHSLLLSGSIGFDQSLDYVAQVPVTKKMVSGDVYKYLKGTSISVPIGGTVSKPSINNDVVQVALKDLILQAGKKQVEDQAGKLLQKLFQ